MHAATSRRRLALVSAAVIAALVGATGVFWTADSPVDRYGSGVAAGPSTSPVGSPATYPTGGEASLAANASPAGPHRTAGGQPRDVPGEPGTENRSTASPGTVPAEPEPDPSDVSQTPEPGPAEDVIETTGGTVLARCDRSTASVEPLDIAPGYRVIEQTRGPGAVRAGIVLGSAENEVHVDVRCRAGEPESTVDVVAGS